MFINAEFRRGLIGVTLTASPRRGRVLAAKAIVLGAVTFLVGLPAAYLALLTGERKQHAGGISTYPVPALTEARLIVGTAALLAVAAVGSGTWHRHLEQFAPMTAGLAIQATTGLHSLPMGGPRGARRLDRRSASGQRDHARSPRRLTATQGRTPPPRVRS